MSALVAETDAARGPDRPLASALRVAALLACQKSARHEQDPQAGRLEPGCHDTG